MSGGFFRGTSADQDTRFSNKQAKLLKTQKFASELDHLVDMTKVKMDVMKPWIARRVTELLGFEDEVLINFVYGLLDGKVVDGKQIQIQLTGFMEKNTGKFMRELWGLLLSAQNNASGVPQQFLDEKEEEMRKKKMESDRITQEIQKKKEGEGPEAAEQKRLDGEADNFRHLDTTADDDSKHFLKKDSSGNPELEWRHGSRRVNRQKSTSPPLNDRSPSVQRSPHAKSSSGTFSNSRSYSEGDHKSRSVSISASPPSHFASHDRRRQSVQRYSTSPHHCSPRILHSSRHLSPNLKRRSSSRTRYRSPSPLRRRSPVRMRRRSPPSPSHRSLFLRRRSRTPLRHRSPSPLHHRTAARSRYHSPLRWHRQSPSPSWRRSPIRSRRRSPAFLRQRSPSPRRKSQSPARRMPPSLFRRSPRHRSPTHKRSPLRSPRYHAVDSQSLPWQRNRILDSEQTLSPERQRSSSREHNNLGDGVDSGRNQERSHAQSFRKDENEKSDLVHNKVDSSSAKPLKARPETPSKPSHSISHAGGTREHENRIHSQSMSPVNQKRGSKARYDILEARRSENPGSREGLQQKISSSIRKSGGRLSETSESEESSLKKPAGKEYFYKDNQVEMKVVDTHEERNVKHLESHPRQVSHLLSEDVEYGPGKGDENCSPHINDSERSNKKHPDSFSTLNEKPRKEKIRLGADERKRSRSENDLSNVEKSRMEVGIYQADPAETDSENGEYKYHKAGKRSKWSEHNGTAPEDEVDCDSSIERRKETRRRRKEEKKMRREEKRRRREERHRKREERRAQKKTKYMDTVTPPPESEQNNDMAGDSDGDPKLKVLRKSHVEEADFEQKKLEIELRNKALESLRAKKAISH